VELSPVLAAMGISGHVGMGAVRFSLGRGTTRAEIDAVVAQLQGLVHNELKIVTPTERSRSSAE
jgi:Cysteine sulfinate desulfinase/cysteine desulfurase and related enzymes